MKQTLRLGVGILIVSLVVLGIASRGDAQTMTKMNIAHSMVSKETASLWVAEGVGFFKKYGIDASNLLITSGPTLIQALVAGDVQMGLTAPPPVLSAVAGGSEMKIVLGQANSMNFVLAGNPRLAKIEDLKGRKVGVSRVGSSTHIGLMLALEHFKMDPGRDGITIVSAGTDPARFAALTAGGLDASILNPGFVPRLRDQGFKVLVDLNELKIPYTQGSFAVSQKLINENPDLVQRVVNALAESIVYCRDPMNKETVVALIVRKMKLRDAREAEGHYGEILATYERKPYPSLEGLRNVIRFLGQTNRKVAQIRPEDVVDVSFVKKLDERGLFR